MAEQYSPLEEPQPKQSKLTPKNKRIIFWLVSTVYIAFAFASLGKNPVASLVLLTLALVLFPPTSKWFQSKININFTLTIKLFIAALGFILLAYIITGEDVSTAGNTELESTLSEQEQVNEVSEEESEKQINNTLVVSSITDGDTIKLDDNSIIRILGIDAPESNECYNKQSTDKAKELLMDRQVRLEADETQDNKDRYDRLLRYVYYADKDFGAEMVKSGMAEAYRDYPVTKLDEYISLENLAKENKLGMWSVVCQPDTAEVTPVTTSASEATTVSEPELEPVTTPTIEPIVEPEPEPAPVVQPTPAPVVEPEPAPVAMPTTGSSYTCNCFKTCAQMDCAEAYYQLNTCGCSKRDNDNDGVPCESKCN